MKNVWSKASHFEFAVVDVESLIRMNQTLRAKDYAVIRELASRLDPTTKFLFTTDPNRLLAPQP